MVQLTFQLIFDPRLDIVDLPVHSLLTDQFFMFQYADTSFFESVCRCSIRNSIINFIRVTAACKAQFAPEKQQFLPRRSRLPPESSSSYKAGEYKRHGAEKRAAAVPGWKRRQPGKSLCRNAGCGVTGRAYLVFFFFLALASTIASIAMSTTARPMSAPRKILVMLSMPPVLSLA